ncbi:hypothetical protein A7A08_00551 [Methyloligella halotolerans]|uniref:CD-NTase-associated protein 15 domain-containing protein n=1 Tax=Methyloligella halotolerans TaxID=1177755 RepID=A0A1E2S316_9HYPH|nr:hypothetical protein A7A08_00551 [Methyloligella halotolerans]
MLNLLPVKIIVTVLLILAGLWVVLATYAGMVGSKGLLADTLLIVRVASSAALIITAIAFAAWRWLPFVQRAIFPYLGGRWNGTLYYDGQRGKGRTQVTLRIRHTLLKIELILDSKESTSRTLAVQARRDAGLNQDHLYYVYSNERKEGVLNAGSRYRGLAIMLVEAGASPKLQGSYFAENSNNGTLRLKRQEPNPWWCIWQ